MDNSVYDNHMNHLRHKKSLSYSRFKWLASIIFLSVFIIAAVQFATKINRPVEGTILSNSRPPDFDVQPADKQIRTKYYTAYYPARYDLMPPPANSASLDAQILVAHQQVRYGTGSRITLTVTPISVDGIRGDSAYKAFEAQPETYTMREEQHGSDTIIIAERKSPNYEQTILWPHGELLLTMTTVAASMSTTLEEEIKTIVYNLQWEA